MPEKRTYCASIALRWTRENPSGIARHAEHAGGSRDEALGEDMNWHCTDVIVARLPLVPSVPRPR